MDQRIMNGKIYDDGAFGGSQIGRISNGRIYDMTWMGGNEIGRICDNGDIIIGGEYVGRINSRNEICEGYWMGGHPVGKITDSGEIRCGFWMGGQYAGRIVFDFDESPIPVNDTNTSGGSSYSDSLFSFEDVLFGFPFVCLCTIVGFIWGINWPGMDALLGFILGPVIGEGVGFILWFLYKVLYNL